MKFPLVLRSEKFPPRPFAGISLCGIIIFRRDAHVGSADIHHELIHFRQQCEWLFVGFFVVYVLEFGYHLLRQRDWMKAYRAISFEREAYRHQQDIDYLNHRPLWANYRKNLNI